MFASSDFGIVQTHGIRLHRPTLLAQKCGSYVSLQLNVIVMTIRINVVKRRNIKRVKVTFKR